MTFPSQHVSVAINRSVPEVYAFAANPANWPQWAAGLGSSIEAVNGDWIAQSPMGRVKVRFTDQNPFGILDHEVTLPSGTTVANPMRVVANGEGCEVIFTVYQRPGVSDDEFAQDVQAVSRDLEALKRLLED
jgi:hypothetical protein